MMGARKDASASGEASSSSSSSSKESSSFLVSPSNPMEVAPALGAFEARLIGGQVIDSLRFMSGEHERRYQSEAGDAFCFSLIERRLMRLGTDHALWCTENLSLRSVVPRCT